MPIWNGRVSPVLDAAARMVVVETTGEDASRRQEVLLSPGSPALQAARINELSLDRVVCGAVSRVLADMLEANGLVLVAWVAGDVDAVLNALADGQLQTGRYAMPGCCRRRGRHGGRMRGRTGTGPRRPG